MPSIEPESSAKKVCLIPKCGASRYPQGKGLCLKCYGSAKKLVADSKTTWARLEELGLADLGETEDKFLKAFNSKKG